MTEAIVPYQTLVISAISEPVQGFRLFELQQTGEPRLVYQAGQYITLMQHGAHEEVRRSYSITSSPVLNEPLTIGVKRLDNGSFSRLLFRLKEGHVLTTTGTGGFFTLPDDIASKQQFVFLAAGAGITPVFSIIKTAVALHADISIILIYSNHSEEQTIFLKELILLEEKHREKFRVEFLFSVHPDLRRARLNPESLYRLLYEHRVDVSNSLFYICGPEAYMRMCVFTLREAGVPDIHIRRENFVVRKKEIIPFAPPDKEPHEVIINHGGKVSVLSVQYPVSILETAKRSGLTLPYSCESGVCGNCAVKCIKGTVWMSNNEVLTDKDLGEGLVLTCTGYPVFGNVLLNIIGTDL